MLSNVVLVSTVQQNESAIHAVGRLFDRHGTTVVTGRGCLGAGRSPDEWGDDRVLRERSGDA